jgi:sugar (pentulose or hexulose) kinase
MTKHVLTLDLGSSGMRAAVVAVDRWRVVGSAERGYRVVRAQDGLAQRFSAGDLRRRIVDCLAQAVADAGVAPSGISVVSVTAQRGGTAFLDDQGQTLYVGPNRDVRAVFEGAAIDDRLAAQVYATTGHLPSAFLAPAKIHWWREHHPRIARRIATVASLGAWAVHMLTGELRETRSTLVEAGLGDVRSGEPASSLLRELEISLDSLPTLEEEGTPTGVLAQAAATAIGIAPGTPVVLAGPDAQVAALGAGCMTPGEDAVMAGWSAPVQRVTAKPLHDDARRTWVVRGAVPGQWASEANPGDTGATQDLIRGMLGSRMTAERFDRLAASAPPSDLPLYALWGPRMLDMSNPGMSLGGLIVPSPVTYGGIDARQVARATLENISFAIHECLEALDEVCCQGAGAVALTGGMAKSAVFGGLLASTLGRPVRRHNAHGAALGAALIATLARSAWTDAARELAERGVVVEPDDDAMDTGERYERWLRLRAGLDALADEV